MSSRLHCVESTANTHRLPGEDVESDAGRLRCCCLLSASPPGTKDGCSQFMLIATVVRKVTAFGRMVGIWLVPAYANRVTRRYWENDSSAVHGDTSAKTYLDFYTAIREVVAPASGIRIADFGCGDGSIAEHFMREGLSIVGTDASQRLLSIARGRGIVCQETEEFFADQSVFDAIYMLGVLLYVHPKGRGEFFRRLRNKLAPGGSLLIFDEPDFSKRNLISTNPVVALLRRFIPIYHVDSAAFLSDLPKTAALALRNGFAQAEVRESWANYRSHLFLRR